MLSLEGPTFKKKSDIFTSPLSLFKMIEYGLITISLNQVQLIHLELKA